MAKGERQPAGVQSVEIGLHVLMTLSRAGGPLALRELAAAAKLSPSKTHRYLVSLCRAGMVEQDGRNGRYDLGRNALTVGLAAQHRLDDMKHAAQAVETLHGATGLTIGLAVWGDHGPTVIRRKEGRHAVTVSTRVGSTMSLLHSNAGRVFVAFLPRERTKALLDAAFAAGPPPVYRGQTLDRAGFERLLDQVRQDRLSGTSGDTIAGIDAVAAPVFDQDGDIVMTLAVMGARGIVDVGPESAARRTLVDTADALSARLGFPSQNRPI